MLPQAFLLDGAKVLLTEVLELSQLLGVKVLECFRYARHCGCFRKRAEYLIYQGQLWLS